MRTSCVAVVFLYVRCLFSSSNIGVTVNQRLTDRLSANGAIRHEPARKGASAQGSCMSASGIFVIPNPGMPAAPSCWPHGLRSADDDQCRPRLRPRQAGRRDDSAQEIAGECRADRRSVDLPVAADLENGFGDRPEDAALTIRAGRRGRVWSAVRSRMRRAIRHDPIYDFDLAVERVAAAAEAAHALAFPFTFVGRAENFLHGRRRSRRHDQAAAGLREGRRRRAVRAGAADLEAIRQVCAVGHASR